MSARKEPHFFNSDQIPAIATLADYEALFQPATDMHRVIGEASTHYLYSRVAVPNILDYSPNSRFVVCMRNPLDMAPALHRECVRQGWETVTNFETAWRLQPLRRRGRQIPRSVAGDPQRLQYGSYCRLAEQLVRLYEVIGPERVQVVLLDDMRRDPAREYRRVLDHLDLDDDGRDHFPVVNSAVQTRSVALSQLIRRTAQARDTLGIRGDWGIAAALRRLNTRPASREPFRAQFRDELRRYFADDIAQLSDLLNRDLAYWLK